MNGTDAPLLIENEPTASEPTVCALLAAVTPHVAETLPLAGTFRGAPVSVDAAAVPPTCMLQPVAATFEVPVFLKVTMHTLLPECEPVVPAVQDCTCALTCAELVNDPNRPNTNPAMAMAAMSVIAIRITVASTGLIAFLFFVILKAVIHSGLGPNA